MHCPLCGSIITLPENKHSCPRVKESPWRIIRRHVFVNDEYSGTVTGYYHQENNSSIVFVRVKAGPLVFTVAIRLKPPLPNVGEEIAVKITEVNLKTKRVFGRYIGIAKPWHELVENLKLDDIIGGVVVGYLDKAKLVFVKAMPEGYIVACNGKRTPSSVA